MLSAFGANISTSMTERGSKITVEGYPELNPQHVVIPQDPRPGVQTRSPWSVEVVGVA